MRKEKKGNNKTNKFGGEGGIRRRRRADATVED
jgi:hypothetical protein